MQISFRNDAEQKNENMPTTLTGPTTMFSVTSSVNCPIQLDKKKI
jgi:hypothetical protein